MFKCQKCGGQSRPGEPQTLVASDLRPVVYRDALGNIQGQGFEWVGQYRLCQHCSINLKLKVP